MKYPELCLGTIEAVVNKLGGMDGVRRFLSGELAVHAGDFFRETGEVAIQIQALPRLTLAELQERRSWIKRIERDTSPTDAITTFKLGKVLRPDEERISGSEYEHRMKFDIVLGYQHAEWLVKHQEAFPAFMALLGKVYIDFPGLIVVDADGNRYFPSLRGDGHRWYLYWRWFGHGLHRLGRLAVSGK